jgi:hypothetical protein
VDCVVRGFVPVKAAGVVALDPALTFTALENPSVDGAKVGVFQLGFGGSSQWFQDIDQKISAGDVIYMTPNSATPTACQLIVDDLLLPI